MAAASRKVLVPLATALAAGAIAVGSGATFTSTSSNTISSVASGTLSHDNSKANSAIFSLDNMQPGDELTGSLALTNDGSLPARLSLTESSSTNQFTGDNLTLEITDVTAGATIYSGTFGGLEDGVGTDLGVMQPGDVVDYRFTVRLDAEAANTEQGKVAGAAYQWDSVQVDDAATTG